MLLGRGRGAVGVEGRVLDAVAVDFADVEVLFYFGDVAGGDAVGCAPDSGWGCGVLLKVMVLVRMNVFLGGRWEMVLRVVCGLEKSGVAYMVCQRFPELAVDERYDAAGVFWCAAVILANHIDISMIRLEKVGSMDG